MNTRSARGVPGDCRRRQRGRPANVAISFAGLAAHVMSLTEGTAAMTLRVNAARAGPRVARSARCAPRQANGFLGRDRRRPRPAVVGNRAAGRTMTLTATDAAMGGPNAAAHGGLTGCRTRSAGNRHRPASDRPVRVNAASPPDRYAATHRRVERTDTPALAAASGNATP